MFLIRSDLGPERDLEGFYTLSLRFMLCTTDAYPFFIVRANSDKDSSRIRLPREYLSMAFCVNARQTHVRVQSPKIVYTCT